MESERKDLASELRQEEDQQASVANGELLRARKSRKGGGDIREGLEGEGKARQHGMRGIFVSEVQRGYVGSGGQASGTVQGVSG